MTNFLHKAQDSLNRTQQFDFLAPLALRLYLVPIMWMAGMKKFSGFLDTVAWFGNDEWGLGLPFPFLIAAFVTFTEIIGAICLFLGLGVRWISIPLFFTMMGAMLTVHWQNGWLAIAESDGFFVNARTAEAVTRLAKAKEILQTQGDYQWLTETGNLVVLNNGVEFAVTYAVMLLVLCREKRLAKKIHTLKSLCN